jgi:hypothetical protein
MSYTPVEALAGQLQREQINRALGELDAISGLTLTLGPFFINDMAGTATTQATLGFFNTATAVSRSANSMQMTRAGRIVGLMLLSDAARTAGTATAAVRINGVGTTFNSGAVQLNATDLTSDSSFVAYADGVAFTAGQFIGCQVTSASWTPTTANFVLYMVVTLEPF